MNIRACKKCGKMVDFEEPWCDHETMEESAWLDIKSRREKFISDLRDPKVYMDTVVDRQVLAAATELGLRAAESVREQLRDVFDCANKGVQ